jgi:hypothetical protein
LCRFSGMKTTRLTCFYSCVYSPITLLTEGAIMRRRVGGAGCGARAGASQAPVREALSPSVPTTWDCLRWLRDRMNAAKAQDQVGRDAPRPDPEARSRGHKSPRWSAGRRACPALGRARRKARTDLVAPFGAPLPHLAWGRKGKAGIRAPLKTPDDAACPRSRMGIAAAREDFDRVSR